MREQFDEAALAAQVAQLIDEGEQAIRETLAQQHIAWEIDRAVAEYRRVCTALTAVVLFAVPGDIDMEVVCNFVRASLEAESKEIVRHATIRADALRGNVAQRWNRYIERERRQRKQRREVVVS